MIAAIHGIIGSRQRLLGDLVPYVWATHDFRKLNMNYTGPVFKVRRASDNTEMDIPFLGVYADTAAFTTFLGGSNGFITTFYDQKQGNHIAQTTTAKQPRVQLKTIGGQSRFVLTYTGSQQLIPTTTSAFSNPNGGTITTVTANLSGNNPGFIAGWGQWSPAGVRANYLSANKYNSATGGTGNNLDTTIAETVPAVFTSMFNRDNPGANTGKTTAFVNGVKKINAVTVAMLPRATEFGTYVGQTPNNTEGLKGDVLGIIRTDDLLADADVLKIHANYQTFYGI